MIDRFSSTTSSMVPSKWKYESKNRFSISAISSYHWATNINLNGTSLIGNVKTWINDFFANIPISLLILKLSKYFLKWGFVTKTFAGVHDRKTFHYPFCPLGLEILGTRHSEEFQLYEQSSNNKCDWFGLLEYWSKRLLETLVWKVRMIFNFVNQR